MANRICMLLFFVIVLTLSEVHSSALLKAWSNRVKKWAPLVYLAKGEEYRPSSVQFFFEHTKIDKKPNTVLTTSTIPKCTSGCRLVSKQKLNSASSILLFFKGQSPAEAPVYAVVKNSGSTTVLYYWFFYPYNHGKKVCVGYQLRKRVCIWGHCKKIDTCIGKTERFGNHVGDWEHIKVTFVNDKATSIHLAYHGNKIEFKLKGNSFVNSNGKKLHFTGTHPILYSARGSHGSWANVGDHVYKTLINKVQLIDNCNKGSKWYTWKNIVMDEFDPKEEYESSPLGFLRFQGRWGNKKRSCFIVEAISGQCVLNNGPTGPGMK